MKIIYNSVIPFRGFCAINLFGILFARKGARISDVTLNHEEIHTVQMKELWYVPFYILYFFEWLYRLTQGGNAYRNISFEREAYENEKDLGYLQSRPRFAMWKKKKERR